MRTVIPHNARFVPADAERVFKGIIYDVYHWQQKMFDGQMATFEMLKRPDTIEVIAIKDDKIMAIIDEQPGLKPKLTLPGGRHDVESETELDCAKREVQEEIGMTFKTWKLIYAQQMHSKIEQVQYLFVASDIEHEGKPTLDEGGEKIELKPMTLDEIKQVGHSDDAEKKWWPTDIFNKVNSLQELIDLPEYRGL